MSLESPSPARTPPVTIIGAGAVGGLLAVLLHRAGVDVSVVARPATAVLINADGIRLQSKAFGDGQAMVPALTEVPSGARLILATKAFALPGLLDELATSRPAEIVSLLNGLDHLDTLRAILPGALVAGASVAVEATRLSPAVIDHRSPFLRLTVPGHAADSGSVTAWRTAGLNVTVGGSDAEVLWTKLRFLAPMALLTSYWGLPVGAALDRDPDLTSALLAEIAAIATSDGVPTEADQLTRALRALPPTMRSSLQNDLDAGRESELDAIGGAVVRRGASTGVPAVLVRRLVAGLTQRPAPSRPTSLG